MRPLRGTNLKRFLRDYRRRHPVEREVVVLLQSVAYPVNVGSAFRLADAAGVKELVLTGITPTPPNATIEKVGRAKSNRVPWRYVEEAGEALEALRADGYHLVAVELAEGAKPYHEYDYPERVCLVVGHEDHGVTRATLAAVDGAVFIPMYGKGRSLNVHTALGIVLFHLLHAA